MTMPCVIETYTYPMMVVNKLLFGLEPEQFPDVLFNDPYSRGPFEWMKSYYSDETDEQYTLRQHREWKKKCIKYFHKNYKEPTNHALSIKLTIDKINQTLISGMDVTIANFLDYRHVMLYLASHGLGYIPQPFIENHGDNSTPYEKMKEEPKKYEDWMFLPENRGYFTKSCELVRPYTWSIFLFLQDHFMKHDKKLKNFNRPASEGEYDKRVFRGIRDPNRHPGINIDDIPREHAIEIAVKDDIGKVHPGTELRAIPGGVIASKAYRKKIKIAAFDFLGIWGEPSLAEDPGRETDIDYDPTLKASNNTRGDKVWLPHVHPQDMESFNKMITHHIKLR